MTDIVGSTELTHRVGDRAWYELLHQHEALVRSLVSQHRGVIVKSRGDGFMLTFANARSAVRFGIALQQALADASTPVALAVRIGMHTGEGIADGLDLYGTHVNLAARIADSATGGQILVSALVRQLAATDHDLAFGDPWLVSFKGLPGQYEVSEALWRDAKAEAPTVIAPRTPT
jgi:class 3 adenylate cyclase